MGDIGTMAEARVSRALADTKSSLGAAEHHPCPAARGDDRRLSEPDPAHNQHLIYPVTSRRRQRLLLNQRRRVAARTWYQGPFS
jgi:hypothetical protein